MSILRDQSSISLAGVITNNTEHIKLEILLLSSKGSLKAKNRSNLTGIIPMFSHTRQSYVTTFRRKTSL